MNKFYILKTSNKLVKSFFEDGIWTNEKETSMLIEKENGKIIQVWGAKGNYGNVGSTVELISSGTCRSLGFGKILKYVDDVIITNISSTYVLK